MLEGGEVAKDDRQRAVISLAFESIQSCISRQSHVVLTKTISLPSAVPSLSLLLLQIGGLPLVGKQDLVPNEMSFLKGMLNEALSTLVEPR